MVKDWKNYVGTKYQLEEALDELNKEDPRQFSQSQNPIVAAAARKDDKEMLAYLQCLVKYLSATQTLHPDAWEYPSAQQMEAARNTLRQLRNTRYTGKRLSDRYLLLQARCAFALKQYAAVCRLWQTEGAQLPASLSRDLLRNLYAGALWRTGKTGQAAEIYAEQHDVESLRFLLYQNRNLKGIRNAYTTHPDSPLLPYLIQDFVNNVQETYDSKGDTAYLRVVDRAGVFANEQTQFINFAEKVIQEKRTQNPTMWQTAIALIYYHQGYLDRARHAAEAACLMEGNLVMKANARLARLFTTLAKERCSDAVLNRMLPELEWMEECAAFDSHFANVRTRLFHTMLIPRLTASHRPFEAAMLLGAEEDIRMVNNDENLTWNPNYSTEYFRRIDTFSADSLKKYYHEFLCNPPVQPWQHVWQDGINKNKTFFFDLIGTKLLREARFTEAEKYLQQPSLDFLNQQNIAEYAARRSYKVERWFAHQALDYDLPRIEMQNSPKLNFCHDILALQQDYSEASSPQAKQRLAYRIATYLCQASAAGDCWYLSRYGNSTTGGYPESYELDNPGYAGDSLQKLSAHYLHIAASSAEERLHEQAIYALAWLPYDPACYRTFEETGERWVWNKKSRQFRALMTLALWRAKGEASPFVTHCDVLSVFAGNFLPRAVTPPKSKNDIFSCHPIPTENRVRWRAFCQTDS